MDKLVRKRQLLTSDLIGGSRIPYVRDGRKIGRNELCPCGPNRGKWTKYKHCCGKKEGS